MLTSLAFIINQKQITETGKICPNKSVSDQPAPSEVCYPAFLEEQSDLGIICLLSSLNYLFLTILRKTIEGY